MADNTIPENANAGCVGPSSEQAGNASACSGCPNQNICKSGELRKPDPAVSVVSDKMSNIQHKIVVLSGKGGVGKSTFSCQLAFSLAAAGYQVGLLDVDICGPSVPQMLGLVGQEVHQSASGWSPVYVDDNLGVMSIAFMLPGDDDAVIWRGPRKNGLIKQFLSDVEWGELDYLVVDTPPGTSDEHLSIVQLLKGSSVDGAVVVTTPQEVSMLDVRREINFCKKTDLPVLGIVENMSGFHINLGAALGAGGANKGADNGGYTASGTGGMGGGGSGGSDHVRIVKRTARPVGAEKAAGAGAGTGATEKEKQDQEEDQEEAEVEVDITTEILQKLRTHCPELLSPEVYLRADIFLPNGPGPRGMAARYNVPYLGRVPVDTRLAKACESGANFLEVFPSSAAAKPLADIVERIVVRCDALAVERTRSREGRGSSGSAADGGGAGAEGSSKGEQEKAKGGVILPPAPPAT